MVLLNLFHRRYSLAVLCTVLGVITVPATAGTLSFFNPSSISKQSDKLHLETQLFLANDAFSIEALFDNFEGKYYYKNGKNHAIGDIRLDVGAYVDTVGYLGYTYRREAVIETSSDTVKLIHEVSNEHDLTLGEAYDLDIKIEEFEVHGITWANTFPLYQRNGWKIQVGAGIELLYGTGGQDGNAVGNARVNAVNDYDFAWQSDYRYTDNYLYDLDVPKVTSFGYTTHLSFQASYHYFTFLGIINDLWGKLYWKNLPYSDVTMSSGNKSYDENGYAEYAPLISGIELEWGFTQTLMRKWRVEGQYIMEDASLDLGNDHINGINMPYIRYTQRYSNHLTMSYQYETKFNMLGMDVKYKKYHLSFDTNRLKDPSALRINLGVHYNFEI